MMVIDTPEKAQKIVEAFEAAERRGPFVRKHNVMKRLEEDKKAMEEIYANTKLRKKGAIPSEAFPQQILRPDF